MLPATADPAGAAAYPADTPDPADPSGAEFDARQEGSASLSHTSGAGGARIGLSGNWLELFDVPVLPLPSFTAT